MNAKSCVARHFLKNSSASALCSSTGMFSWSSITEVRRPSPYEPIAVPNVTQFEMMVRAINETKSTDAVKVAQALEGMEQKDLFGATSIMRKEDHQLLHPYYEAVFTKDVKYDVEKTGLGWKTQFKTTVADETLPTTCKMKRPSS